MVETGALFVGIDAAEGQACGAVAEPGRSGQVRYIGEIDVAANAARKLLTRLAKRYGRLQACYG